MRYLFPYEEVIISQHGIPITHCSGQRKPFDSPPSLRLVHHSALEKEKILKKKPHQTSKQPTHCSMVCTDSKKQQQKCFYSISSCPK